MQVEPIIPSLSVGGEQATFTLWDSGTWDVGFWDGKVTAQLVASVSLAPEAPSIGVLARPSVVSVNAVSPSGTMSITKNT